ncbi:MAG TPA: DNA-3-methyladenine glycosylase [Gemmatimonadaceae bacterium]|nr:DNA-3-methyladenine glycosylase [Gemmatimonadaceae bacterium]
MSRDAALTARRSGAGRVLPRDFFDRETEVVARELLGAVLECRTAEGTASGMIVETEAYLGEHDPACHAAVGRTPRTAPLYGAPGSAYVYFIYGMYWCVNAVTRAEGLPSAVLIRALEPLQGLELMRTRRPLARRDSDLCSGPGKLCLALGIGPEHNGLSMQKPPLRLRSGIGVCDADIALTPRVGITQAVEWPLRWVLRGNPHASRPAKRGATERP